MCGDWHPPRGSPRRGTFAWRADSDDLVQVSCGEQVTQIAAWGYLAGLPRRNYNSPRFGPILSAGANLWPLADRRAGTSRCAAPSIAVRHEIRKVCQQLAWSNRSGGTNSYRTSHNGGLRLAESGSFRERCPVLPFVSGRSIVRPARVQSDQLCRPDRSGLLQQQSIQQQSQRNTDSCRGGLSSGAVFPSNQLRRQLFAAVVPDHLGRSDRLHQPSFGLRESFACTNDLPTVPAK